MNIAVPAMVPSLAQSSSPWLSSLPMKKIRPAATVSDGLLDPIRARGTVPEAVPSVAYRRRPTESVAVNKTLSPRGTKTGSMVPTSPRSSSNVVPAAVPSVL